MGTWGSGNFDNDYALDYLSTVCAPLVDTLAEVVAHPEVAEADENGGIDSLVAAEILTNLCRYYYSERLTPELITNCRDIVLSQWDATIDELDPKPAYKIERRQVMQQTFERLLVAVQR